MGNGNFFSKLLGIFGGGKPSGAKILYSNDGRGGYVHYQSRAATFAFYYEFGGGEVVASIYLPSLPEWEKETGLPLARRDEVLNFMGRQVVKDQTSYGRGSFKIEKDFLNIYV
ncbi:MAG: hypothetical protein ABIQ93_17335 [Saprospiraceae bacterium]